MGAGAGATSDSRQPDCPARLHSGQASSRVEVDTGACGWHGACLSGKRPNRQLGPGHRAGGHQLPVASDGPVGVAGVVFVPVPAALQSTAPSVTMPMVAS